MLCEKCFAMAPKGSEFCPECGAPLTDGPGDGSDASVYPELAKANLLRMRGEFKPAEDVCLGILRRYPNNSTANTLLGDIAVEKGDLEQAAEWYELALDIVPDSAAVQEKLESVKRQMEARQTVSTAEQIGIAPAKPKTGLYIALAVLAVITVGGVALAINQNRQANIGKPNPNVDQPLVIDKPALPPPSTTGGSEGRDQENDLTAFSAEDRALTTALKALPETSSVLVMEKEPGTTAVIIRFTVPLDQEVRTLAANLASAAFSLPETEGVDTIRLRGFREGRIQFFANADRASWLATQTEEWKNANAGRTDALADAILKDEGPAPGSPTPAPNPDAPVSSTPTTSGNTGTPNPAGGGVDPSSATGGGSPGQTNAGGTGQ